MTIITKSWYNMVVVERLQEKFEMIWRDSEMNFKKIAACAAAAFTLVCSATAMSASAAEKMYAFKLGDVNGDKRIDVTDVSMINAHIRGYYPIKTDKGMGAADVNFDGKIDVEDFNAVSDELLGNKPLAHGDVNGDGDIDVEDAVIIISHITIIGLTIFRIPFAFFRIAFISSMSMLYS